LNSHGDAVRRRRTGQKGRAEESRALYRGSQEKEKMVV
jgi:hypothetical protein